MNKTQGRPSPALVVSICALVLAMGGAAWAATKIDTPSIATGAITTSKLAKNAVSKAKIKDEAVTGAEVDEETLGAVPALAGRTPFFQPLQNGESVVIARNGLITLSANCAVNNNGNDEVSITAKTAQDGAVLKGTDELNGYDDNVGVDRGLLNIDTPATHSRLAYTGAPSSVTSVDNDADEGFVLGPDGKGFSIDGDQMRLGLNYLNLPCFVSGILTQIG